MLNPLTPAPFVGRQRELAALSERLTLARRGKGGVVLVAGEAGIGKSRLVAEVATLAAGDGFLILQGNCFEADRALPYAPLLDLLRTLLGGNRERAAAEALGSAAPALLRLLPDLASTLPEVTPPSALDPEQEKRRFFATLMEFFGRLATTQPVLIVVEDLHWGDDMSLELLLFLARHLATQPILLLLTHRSDEVHRELAHTLAELERRRLAVGMVLPRLARAEVEVLIRSRFGQTQPVHPDFLDTIAALTAGNPFFIEEVLASLVASGDIFYARGRWDRKPIRELQIPRTVQDAVRSRAATLSDAARDTLLLAAVVGQRFEFSLLQELTGQDERSLVRQIKEMIAAHLVVEESADRFAFRHALTQQAIASELLERERRALHRSIAEALERIYADALDAHVEDLAYHFHAAGVWPQARLYAQRAAERAQALYAPRATVEHVTRALEAAGHLGATVPISLYRARGLALDTLGDFDGAREDLDATLDLARATGDRSAEWRALLDLGLLWASRDYTHTGAYYRQALDLARTSDDPAALAQSLNRLGNWLVNVDQPLDARRYHEEALAIFRGLDDRRGLAETLDLLGMANSEGGDEIQAAACYRQAIPLFEALDDRAGLSSSLVTSMVARFGIYGAETELWAEPDAAGYAEDGERALAVARAIDWRAGEAFALFNLALCRGLHGDYADALVEARTAIAIAEEIDHRQWLTGALVSLGALYLDLLDGEEARRHLERASTIAHELGSLTWTLYTSGLLVRALILRRAFDDAESLLVAVLDRHPPVPLPWRRLVIAARAELLLARGEPDSALPIVEELIASAANMAPGRVIPYLWRLRGEALTALGRPAEGEADLQVSLGVARTLGLLPLCWRIHLALGALYRAQARADDAQRQFTAARTTIEELAWRVQADPAAESDEAALGQHFRAAATALLPRPRPLTPLRAAKQAYGGLTAREREVAELVARGMSNRAIAEALVIGERTVEGHVANIMAKLGFSARTQIAAWAVERGLLNGQPR